MTRMIKRAPNSSFHRLSGLAICITLIALAGSTVAQVQPNYGRTYSKKQVEKLIKDVDKSGDEFRRDFDSWLDRSPLDGQQREDRYNRQVKELTNVLSTLRSNFGRSKDWWQSRRDMQSVLNQAGQVNTIVGGAEVRGRLNRRWGNLRTNLNRLADAFNCRQSARLTMALKTAIPLTAIRRRAVLFQTGLSGLFAVSITLGQWR